VHRRKIQIGHGRDHRKLQEATSALDGCRNAVLDSHAIVGIALRAKTGSIRDRITKRPRWHRHLVASWFDQIKHCIKATAILMGKVRPRHLRLHRTILTSNPQRPPRT